MRKVSRISAFFGILVLLLLLLCSCGKGKLIAPTGLRVDGDTLTLKWNRISGALAYEIEIQGGGSQIVSTNSFSLEYLAPGTYEIRIRAKGEDGELKDSAWVSLSKPFVREKESGLKYKLINNKTAYQLVGAGYAEGDVVMESVYRGKPVTSIGDKALSGCKDITSFTVGEHVTSIGKSAFARSAMLETVILPEGLQYLGESAFQSCKQLKRVNIPNGVTEILPYTFSWCSAMDELTLGNGIVSVGDFAFSNCEALTSVSLPASLRTVGEYAFSDCTALADLELGGNIEQIHAFAFCNCINIPSVDFGQALQFVGDESFSGCSSLGSIVIPDSCISVGNESFRYCSNVSSVTLGQGLRSIGINAFRDTAFYDACNTIVAADGWILGCRDKEITGIVGNDVLPGEKDVVMPSGIIGIADNAFRDCEELSSVNLKGVKYIGVFAFGYCDALWEVVADDSLKVINNYAFAMCEMLGDVFIGDGLEYIGDYAFYGCAPLRTIDLPASLTSIGILAFDKTEAYKQNPRDPVVYVDDWAVGFNGEKNRVYTDIIIKNGTRGIANYAFYGAPVNLSIEIPESVEYIGKGAFYKCSILANFKMPMSGIKYIGDFAFYGCSQASFGASRVLTIPAGTVSIGRSAFYECTGIVGLIIPNTVTTIGDYAFYGCVNIGQSNIPVADGVLDTLKGYVVFEEGLTSLGNKAFCGCAGLKEIVLPDSLTTLGERAFYKCEKLESVTFGTLLKNVPDYSFYGCSALKEITAKGTIETVGKYAFRGCALMESFNLEGVKSIGDSAFFGCESLKRLTIPGSLTSIGNFAFRGCTGLQSIIIPKTLQHIGNHAFYGCSSATIYVEGESNAPHWSERWNSSYRPAFYGVVLSEDHSNVISVTIENGSPQNADAIGGINGPGIDGYKFIGWATEQDGNVIYSVEQTAEIPQGTVLYPRWELIPETPEE